MGINIPAKFFDLEMGSLELVEYYEAFAGTIRRLAVEERYGDINISHGIWADIENRPLSYGAFAVPFAWHEVRSISPAALVLSTRSPRTVPFIECSCGIDPEVRREISADAIRRRLERLKSGKQDRPATRGVTQLFDEDGVSTCGSGHAVLVVECAVKLKAWWRRDGIIEFSHRNALRAVGSSYLEDVVNEALRLLKARGLYRGMSTPVFQPSRAKAVLLVLGEPLDLRVRPTAILSPDLFRQKSLREQVRQTQISEISTTEFSLLLRPLI